MVLKITYSMLTFLKCQSPTTVLFRTILTWTINDHRIGTKECFVSYTYSETILLLGTFTSIFWFKKSHISAFLLYETILLCETQLKHDANVCRYACNVNLEALSVIKNIM